MITHPLLTQYIIDNSSDEQLEELVESSPETAVEVMRQYSEVIEEYKAFHARVVESEANLKKEHEKYKKQLIAFDEEVKGKIEEANAEIIKCNVIIKALWNQVEYYQDRDRAIAQAFGGFCP